MNHMIDWFRTFFLDIRPSAALIGLALVVLIVTFFLRYRKEMAPRLGTLEWIHNFDRPKFSLDGRRYPMLRRDFLAMLIILAGYGIVAFWNLGSAQAPQSFYSFTEENTSVTIDLGEKKEISQIMYYSGLYPGDYSVSYSANRSNWVYLTDETAVADESGYVNDSPMHQSYADLFKWQYVSLSETFEARYIRIEARNLPMELGELALYDTTGHLIDVAGVDSVLLDEQQTVPDSPSWYNSMYFDEIYHGRTAYEHIQNIYPYEITHPPLGKLLIALGIQLFGMTPFGYRFMGTFFGVLMLIPLYVLIKNMFGKTRVAICGTVLFAFEFMHFTQTRIATIDTYGVFFTLVAFAFMWRWISAPYADGLRWSWSDLALSGLAFGLGCASKWTVLYSGVGLAILWLLRVVMKVRAYGIQVYLTELWATIGLSVVSFVVVPVIIYCLSYIPYGLAVGMTLPEMLLSRDYYQLIWDNQVYMLTYHAGVSASHPYSSRWYQWLFDLKPILYYLEYNGNMKSAFGAFNSPLTSWAGLLALFACCIGFYQRRKPQVILILVGYLSQVLPWVFISRITFSYHYFGGSLFLTLAISYVFSELLARREKNDKLMYAFASLQLVLFAAFYPVLSGVQAATEYCLNFLKWLPKWPWG